MHTRAYRHRLFQQVDVGEVAGYVEYLGEAFTNKGFAQMPQVQKHAAVNSPALVYLGLLGPGNHVAGGEFHHVGRVALHEAVAFGVEQVSALASRALGYEDAAALERRGVVLHHLHVHQGRADAVGQPHAVAGADKGVGGRLEDTSETAGGHYDGLGSDDVYVAGAYLHDNRARALAIFDQYLQDEPFFIDADAGAHYLFVEYVEEGLSGEVGHEEGAGLALPSEGAGAQASLFVAAEGDSVVFHLDDFGAGLAAT